MTLSLNFLLFMMNPLPTLSHGRQGLNHWREQLHNVCGRFETLARDDVSQFFGAVQLLGQFWAVLSEFPQQE